MTSPRASALPGWVTKESRVGAFGLGLGWFRREVPSDLWHVAPKRDGEGISIRA